jgi:hypothetical protein
MARFMTVAEAAANYRLPVAEFVEDLCAAIAPAPAAAPEPAAGTPQ